MELKDYLSVIALVVATISAIVSWRNAGFGRRTKSVELRAELLARVSETALVTSRLRNVRDSFLALANDRGDTATIRELELPEIEANQDSIALVYSELANASIDSALKLYEQHFHRMGEICDRTRGYLERLSAMKAHYESSGARA